MLRFDPFGNVEAMTRSLLSDDGTRRSPRFMPMDLYKVEDHYVVDADLPGIDPGSIDISVDNGTLSISAQRTARSDEGVQWLASERFSGQFRRELTLGEGIDRDNITAVYDNGVLSVIIPLAEKAKPRRIEISHTAKTASSQAIES
ncbi:Hsp20/alpha crystallin family protein [Arthrobacter russicus]|uniref:HSP20 family protein n=1 Tax=Arthrobacter russicus TaxID=172040 RepID=A0ABU1JED8_9MICC|nr:Hsp20/alpha crystallin family protein [Arthrobacter russicus]MDR6270750.1 HSP20 family protein [Arthrobacter russicus]